MSGVSSSVSGDKQMPPLNAIIYCTPHSSSNRSQTQKLVKNCNFCPSYIAGPRRNIAITFGVEKLE